MPPSVERSLPATAMNFPSSGSDDGSAVYETSGFGAGVESMLAGTPVATRPCSAVTVIAKKIEPVRRAFNPERNLPYTVPPPQSRPWDGMFLNLFPRLPCSQYANRQQRARTRASDPDVHVHEVSVRKAELGPQVGARDQLEVVRVVRAEREDHGRVHPVHGREEALRPSERS